MSKKEKKQKPKDAGEKIRDNLEAIFISIIMALVIRFYAIEAFKIPTSSMEPTLIGNPDYGDRILVNKSAYYHATPKRWDVIVFKYPNNTSRNFIKRLIGLPGEKIRIKNGDIYINDEIARKPDRVQKDLLYPIFKPSSNLETALQESWDIIGGDDWRFEDGKLLLINSKGKGIRRYVGGITAENYNPLFHERKINIGDILLSVKATSKGIGNLLCHIQEHDRVDINLLLASEGSKEASCFRYKGEGKEENIPISLKLQPGEEYTVTLSNIDDLAVASVNGEKLAQVDYKKSVDNASEVTDNLIVEFGGESGDFSFEYISLWRDIYYTNSGNLYFPSDEIYVPSKRYFVLGDNSPYSRDSREWRIFKITLKNGITYEGDEKDNPDPGPRNGYFEFVDTMGINRKFAKDEVRHFIDSKGIHHPYSDEPCFANEYGQEDIVDTSCCFVPEDCLLGQALVVFWPMYRVKFIK